MEKSKVENIVQFAKDGKLEITHLTGDAKEFLKPVKPLEKEVLDISGNIDSVHEFLKKRESLFNPDDCHIWVNLDSYVIGFVGDEQQANNKLITTITGKISKTKSLNEIPFGQSFEPIMLARELRMRKHLFEDGAVFKDIFTRLSSFKAHVEKEIENSDDRSGNAKQMIKQSVVHDIPSKFDLRMQILKGAPVVKFEVEIDIDASNLECTLISPDLESLISEKAENIINDELDKDLNGAPMRDFCFTYTC